MELRKDPITRSWVITGDDVPDHAPRAEAFCRFCPDSPVAAQLVSNMPGVDGGLWSARAVVHPTPLYRIEGEPTRRGDGIYDRMSSVGAHEVLVENIRHDRQLWNASDTEIEQFLVLAAHRIQDLKRDARFKYVSIFKNHGRECRAGIRTSNIRSLPRQLLCRGGFSTNCAPAETTSKPKSAASSATSFRRSCSRTSESSKCAATLSRFVLTRHAPYETWILPRTHEAAFERYGLCPSCKHA